MWSSQLFGQMVLKKALNFVNKLSVMEAGLMGGIAHDMRCFVGLSLGGIGSVEENP